MITHIFSFKELFPELFERSVKPITAIPVFFEDRQIAKTSLNDHGEFAIVLPFAVERQVGRGSLRYLPLCSELNHNLDPSKVRLQMTGIRLSIRAKQKRNSRE